MPDFVHLHLHSEYSLLDSTIKLDRLLARVEELNMNACAITDSGNMFGTARFYFAARERGIKPIIGSEMFVAQGSRFDQARKERRPGPYHLVLIAYNNTGYRNLMKLSSLSHLEGYYYGPRIDKELLAKYNEGLICLTGCLSGEIPRLIRRGSNMDLYGSIEEHLSIFGERLYFELQNNGYERQKRVNERLVRLSKHFGVPLVATNNCRYLDRKEREAYETLIAIRHGKRLDKMKFARMITENLHLRSAQEMEQVFSNYPEALKNTLRIAEMCHVHIDTGTYHLPDPLLPAGTDAAEHLERKARRGLDQRLPVIRSACPSFDNGLYQKYLDRLTYELNIIRATGFAGYLLVIADFVNWAKARGIPVGPGRGPVAGSLVAYCLGITDIDPIRHDLMFELFLNPERITLPDVSVDFCRKGRDDVIHYITEKYGEDRVAHIIVFGSMLSRAAIRNVGKVLGVPGKKIDKIAGIVPQTRHGIAETLEKEPGLMKLHQKEKHLRQLLDNARALEGIVCYTSAHTAGIIIADSDLTDRVPLCRDRHDNAVTQYDMGMLERIGLIKFDFLGLETLTLIHDVIGLLADEGVHINISRIPLDDEKTYDLLSSGDTSGVFQLEAEGVRDILVKLKPSRFSDIAAVIALYRPGPMRASLMDEFVKRKNDPSLITYAAPKLADTLQDTYGVLVYQEQVMKIATVLAGFPMKDADALRRAVGRKIARHKKQFVVGAVANDVPKDVAERVYDTIMRFGEYGYKKSHAVAYGLITYRTAYLKANYYKHFMAVLLTYRSYCKDMMKRLIAECEKHRVAVLPFDGDKGEYHFTVDNDKITPHCANFRK